MKSFCVSMLVAIAAAKGYPGDQACRVCENTCAPCKLCTDSQGEECEKCWQCWGWDDDAPTDEKHCDALDKDHDWDADEVRCLTNDTQKDSGGDGRRRTGRRLGALGGDGRRRMSPSDAPVDCRACWEDAPDDEDPVDPCDAPACNRTGHNCDGCPNTKVEQDIADIVRYRKCRVSSGKQAKLIELGRYGARDLEDEMYKWWVRLGMDGQVAAIDNFVDLMQDAKDQGAKKDFSDVAFGWLDQILDVIVKPPEIIKDAVSVLEEAIHTYKEAADAGEDSDGTFLSAAVKFREKLSSKEGAQLLFMDPFFDELKDIVPDSDYHAAILAAYDLVTDIIAATPSDRKSFNQYYLAYMDSQSDLDPDFRYAWSKQKENGHDVEKQGIFWRAAPKGLKACVIADTMFDLNDQCIDPHKTPGLEKMRRSVQVMWDGPTGGLRLDCDNLDLDAYTGCWYPGEQGKFLNNSDKGSHGFGCDTVHGTIAAGQQGTYDGWPTQEAKDFCSGGITPELLGGEYIACADDNNKGHCIKSLLHNEDLAKPCNGGGGNGKQWMSVAI